MSAQSGSSVVALTGWDALHHRVERLRDVVMDEEMNDAFGGSYPEERSDVAAPCDAVLALIESARRADQ